MEIESKNIQRLFEIITLSVMTNHEEPEIRQGLENIGLLQSDFDRLVVDLHFVNVEIWKLEVRSDVDFESWHTKRRHELNTTRVKLVSAIDQIIWGTKPPILSSSYIEQILRTDTPGMVIDRLSVLQLKLVHGADVSKDTDYLTKALDFFIAGIKDGSQIFHVFTPAKVYDKKPFVSGPG